MDWVLLDLQTPPIPLLVSGKTLLMRTRVSRNTNFKMSSSSITDS